MIIGTAGHIDHGKTTLVKALTGVATDRLQEEQKRGITIELGYAYSPTQQAGILGFVDAPGHEKLVHTMISGASGIDFGMLVIAADDGVMPQTNEHLAVLSLLGVQQGAVVISKIDRASPARIAQVQAQVHELTKNSFLAQAPIFPVDATNPNTEGVRHLRQYLEQQALQQVAPHTEHYFRLAIDRVFTLQGHGTVVTGTVHSGTFDLQKANELMLMPAQRPVRVRSIRSQNQASTLAQSGQRCALNLAGIDVNDIQRGDWIAHPDCFLPSLRLDVTLQLLPQSEAELRTWTPWHVHIGAAHYLAHAVPLEPASLQAGEQGLVQLVFDQPVCASVGDRFILRNAQAKQTVGGGRVLATEAPDRKRRSPARLALLHATQHWLNLGELQPLLEQAPYGLDNTALQRLLGGTTDTWTPPDATVWLASESKQVGPWLFTAKRLEHVQQTVLATLQQFHALTPEEPGVNSSRLRRMSAPAMPLAQWQALVLHLLRTNQLVQQGNWLHLPAHTISLNAHDQALAARILPLSLAGAFDPPWVRDIARQLEVDEALVRQLMRHLTRRGDLYQIVHDLFYHHTHMAQLAQILAQLAVGQTGVNAARFRDATGLGRKRAIQILEFFNRTGYTRRLRDRHVLRGDPWQELNAV
ncbi:selenocysteine-specific translation elongation factor [Alcaligenes endophyticus]|uniref:Selenocysteine-specific elongation factor n=1 Tax=Alcaligenes endophyticus TaxID=1929088 RepID=A0ABT8ELW7_9BURK|nr:selenocysteine-specific translation elongation factor [Alcaligenes endophyticus]MCX5591237.1 selenocysteine-specific translation elongation factor [Alcaligenes endophyticus]MDN4122185.1 selenocysteine-specific translation elongation factor [Alcaligenes endophyticus]